MSFFRNNFLRSLTFLNNNSVTQVQHQSMQRNSQITLKNIYTILNSPQNYIIERKKSSNDQQSGVMTNNGCNCKKSKCLKLYCECFSQGNYCIGCNCINCENTPNNIQIRNKAIKEIFQRPNTILGRKKSMIQGGCNCKKTNCIKKYCECYSTGEKCHELCRCNNCQNYQN